MSLWAVLALILAIMAGVGALLWYLLIKTEGVYLGRSVVIWLYDVYARRYDGIKAYDPVTEDSYLARPLMQHIPYLRAPLVLDVATGTGRLPLALFDQPHFQGRIIALDLSRRMLREATDKLTPFADRVDLLHLPAEHLPFADDTFDVVTCLEALEFMMQPLAVLQELIRVLRPGGLLVITNRQGLDARLMPGKTWDHDDLAERLRAELGLAWVDVQVWQVDYRLVFGFKAGKSSPTGPRRLEEVWMCPHCGAIDLIPAAAGDAHPGWRCLTCETHIPVGDDGVIEVAGVPTQRG